MGANSRLAGPKAPINKENVKMLNYKHFLFSAKVNKIKVAFLI